MKLTGPMGNEIMNETTETPNQAEPTSPAPLVQVERLVMRFYLWVDSEGEAVTKAWQFSDAIELDAVLESPPVYGYGLRTGNKAGLMKMYDLDESDFIEA